MEGIDKIRYPSTPVIVVTIGDEDVIFKVGEDGGHEVKVDFKNQISILKKIRY